MRKIAFLFLLLFLPFSAIANEPVMSLIVWAKDGTKVAYALCEKPKVTFTETDLVITTKGVEVNYALEDMARFTYESNNEANTIVNLQTNEFPFKLSEDTLLFPNLEANSTISIYSLNGMFVFSKTVCQGGEYASPLSNFATGVYIVKVNSLIYKIAVK